jgi:hypothetical protein
VKLLLPAAIGLVSALALGRAASLPPAIYFEHDQRVYLAMSRSPMLSGGVAHAPFCWRPLLPALVRATPLDPPVAFHVWMLAVLAALPPLTAMFLRAAGVRETSAMAGGLIAAIAPPVAGFLSWDVIRPDGLSLLLVVLASLCFLRQWRAGFLLSMLLLAAAKETWVIAAAFAALWSTTMGRRAMWLALAGMVLAGGVTVLIRWLVPASAPYSFLANARELYWPFSAAVPARRLMLATAGTWNVLAPVAAYSLARRRRDAAAWAVAAAVAIATAQVAVAIDTQRLVAAALPFVLLACAWELDRARRPLAIAAAVALAQLPWLLAYARIWPVELRVVHIITAIATVVAGVAGLMKRDRPVE